MSVCHFGRFVLVCVAAAAAAFTFTCSATAGFAVRAVVPGHVPEAVSKIPANGRLDATKVMHLSLHLPLRDAAGLAAFLADVSDPASPNFRHYLGDGEFDVRFGPTAADYEAVVRWAGSNGLTVAARHASRRLVQVTAPVSQIERAFNVTLRTYQHPTEARSFFAPDTEPSVEAGVPVEYIAGLDNFASPRPANLRRRPVGPVTGFAPQGGSGPNGNLAGIDYRAAYVPGVALTGAGQTIGLLEFDGFNLSDVTSYESELGLAAVPLQTITLDSFDGSAGTNNSEVALDIEMAVSMAPGLSKVVVFESNPDPSLGFFNDILAVMSTNLPIKQFSCSWGAGSVTTAQRKSMDTYFQQLGSQGQSFFCAAGDGGATTSAILAPFDDPYITVVGGTVLAVAGPGGGALSEVVWNTQEGPGGYATGGGVSTSYAIPAWQKGLSMTANHGSTTHRNCPDVAMVADNIYIVADSGTPETTGGTSASAPLWAGFAALVNQQAVAHSLPTIGFINPAIYQIGTNAYYQSCFNDITFGNNTNNIVSEYVATPGYDLCTGWGSPIGGSLLQALLQPDGLIVTPARGPVANGPVAGPFNLTSQVFSLTNASKATFNWAVGNTSSWLTVSAATGSLATGTVASVTASLNQAAAKLPAGVYTADLWFTNLTSGLAQARQVSLQAGQDLVVDGGFEAGDLCYWLVTGSAGFYTNDFPDNGYSTGYSPEAGVYFLAMGEIGGLGYVSQNLPTHPGQLYSLSLWMENPQGIAPNQFQVQWITNSTSATTLYNGVNLGVLGWTPLQYVVRAATTNTTLRIGARNDPDFFCVDAVSVLPVPAPTLQVSTTGGSAQLSWATLAGVQYQPQYRTNITQTNWVSLGAALTASTNSISVEDPLQPGQARFYRVEVLP